MIFIFWRLGSLFTVWFYVDRGRAISKTLQWEVGFLGVKSLRSEDARLSIFEHPNGGTASLNKILYIYIYIYILSKSKNNKRSGCNRQEDKSNKNKKQIKGCKKIPSHSLLRHAGSFLWVLVFIYSFRL